MIVMTLLEYTKARAIGCKGHVWHALCSGAAARKILCLEVVTEGSREERKRESKRMAGNYGGKKESLEGQRQPATTVMIGGRKAPATTGDTLYAECQMLCLVFYIGHSAKERFAECHSWQKTTHGKKVVCLVPNTRQTATLGKSVVCLVPGTQHSANQQFA